MKMVVCIAGILFQGVKKVEKKKYVIMRIKFVDMTSGVNRA